MSSANKNRGFDKFKSKFDQTGREEPHQPSAFGMRMCGAPADGVGAKARTYLAIIGGNNSRLSLACYLLCRRHPITRGAKSQDSK